MAHYGTTFLTKVIHSQMQSGFLAHPVYSIFAMWYYIQPVIRDKALILYVRNLCLMTFSALLHLWNMLLVIISFAFVTVEHGVTHW